jgi:hypothetical protein
MSDAVMWSAAAAMPSARSAMVQADRGNPNDSTYGTRPKVNDVVVAKRLERAAAVRLPAVVATAHVQRGWRSAGNWSRSGTFSLVHDVGLAEYADFNALNRLPSVGSVRPLRSFMISDRLDDVIDLRGAAAELQSDVLLIYTFETTTRRDTTVPVVGVVTLGAAPNVRQIANSAATGAFIDVRTGFVYDVFDARAEHVQPANAWTSDEAALDAVKRVEGKAAAAFTEAATERWKAVVERSARPRLD